MKRELFALPDGIYMDGNSLGLMPHSARQAVLRRLDQWQRDTVGGWDAWFGLAEQLSPSVARLVGAQPNEVIATGSITVNLHALVGTFYRPQGQRRHLLATALDFPSDVYALQSWADQHGAEVRLIPSRDGRTLHEDDIAAALTDEIAVALLPTVLYRSGQLLDVERWTADGQAQGILMGWDTAHGVGSVVHHFHDHNVDFAVWCHYKHVNAGPGAPGGLFIHERHHHRTPALRGWWGNDKGTQFEMALDYRKAAGAGAYQLGSPAVLAYAALEGALEVFDQVSMADIRARSLELTDLLIALADEHLPELEVVTPRAHAERGGHVALSHPQAHALSLALRARGVIPDFRQPDILRLAPVALYNTGQEVRDTVEHLRAILDLGEHLQEQQGSLVT